MSTQYQPEDAEQVTGDPARVTADAFKQVFRRHPAGVAVISLNDANSQPVGFTATSAISLAAGSPSVAFSLAATSRSWPTVARSGFLVINFLTVNQADTSLLRFAGTDIDRFAVGGWTRLETGEPVLDGSDAWLQGGVARRIPVGPSFLTSSKFGRRAAVGQSAADLPRSHPPHLGQHAVSDIAAVSGNPRVGSRTHQVALALAEALSDRTSVTELEVITIADQLFFAPDHRSAELKHALPRLRGADVAIIATPV